MNIKDKYLNFYYETIGEIEEPTIDPKKTALLLVDLQNEFVILVKHYSLRLQENGKDGFRSMIGWMILLSRTIKNYWISLEQIIWSLHMEELLV